MSAALIALLTTAFVTALAGSAHCLGMCGGIGASLGLNAQRQRFIFAYHAGRLLSYGLLGLLLGSILPLFGKIVAQPAWGVWLRYLTAGVMCLIGIQLLLDKNWLRAMEQYGIRLWRPIGRIVQHFVPVQSHSDAFILGMLWGLLPCGLIYAALALAISSGNPFTAMLMMCAFGVGTLPAMLSLTLFSKQLSNWLAKTFIRRLLGVVVIIFACWTWQASVYHANHHHHHHVLASPMPVPEQETPLQKLQRLKQSTEICE